MEVFKVVRVYEESGHLTSAFSTGSNGVDYLLQYYCIDKDIFSDNGLYSFEGKQYGIDFKKNIICANHSIYRAETLGWVTRPKYLPKKYGSREKDKRYLVPKGTILSNGLRLIERVL